MNARLSLPSYPSYQSRVVRFRSNFTVAPLPRMRTRHTRTCAPHAPSIMHHACAAIIFISDLAWACLLAYPHLIPRSEEEEVLWEEILNDPNQR